MDGIYVYLRIGLRRVTRTPLPVFPSSKTSDLMLSKDRRDVDPITGAFRRTVQIDRRGLGSLGGEERSRAAHDIRFDEIVSFTVLVYM